MANAHVVVTGSSADTPHLGKVFEGINFFLVRRMPSRSQFVKDIETNGGRVVTKEPQADYIIADHLRKDAPPGSYSYQFIEAAMKDGQLPDPSEHVIRPLGTVREVGSTVMGKSTRTPFTLEDDTTLWNWVQARKAEGASIKGNEIYKQLEAINSRHTFQAWRDRYIKKLHERPPVGVTVSTNPTLLPPATAAEDNGLPNGDTNGDTNGNPIPEAMPEFSKEDFDSLMQNAEDIEDVPARNWEDAWAAFASVHNWHTAEEWIILYERDVRPEYRKIRETVKGTTASDQRAEHAEAEQETKKRKRISDEAVVQPEQIKKRKTSLSDVDASAIERANGSSRSRQDSVDLHTKDGDNQIGESIAGLDSMMRNSADQPIEPVLTSDLNVAADLQVQREAGINPADLVKQSQEKGNHGLPAGILRTEEELPTSDANRAAEAQFGEWAAGSNNIEEGDNTEHHHAVQPEPEPETSDGPRHALTAVNLANQQAEHESPTTRGMDIPKDDENMDQSSFAMYLQGVLGQKVEPEKDDELPAAQSDHEESESHHTVHPGGIDEPSERIDSDGNLPLSSQQEVDDAFENGLHWPASPQQRKKEPVMPRLSSEAQVDYPQLPPQPQDHISQIDPDLDLPAQALMSQLNEANSSHRRGSGSQTHDNGELVFPDYDELVNGTDPNDDDAHDDMSQRDVYGGVDNINGDDGDDIDLTIAEPEGGFEAPDSPYEDGAIDLGQFDEGDAAENTQSQSHSAIFISSRESSSSLSQDNLESEIQPDHANGARPSHAVETQDIINAETQQPDFEVPWPIESDDEFVEQSPPRSQRLQAKSKGSTQAIEPELLDNQEKVAAWISTMVIRGHKRNAVIKALKRTSMRTDLATLVLIEERAGKGLPDDVSGVWSEREDRLLESGDAQGLSALSDKHGWKEMDARMEFLGDWRGLG